MTAQMKFLLRAQAEESWEELQRQVDAVGGALCLWLEREQVSTLPPSDFLLMELKATTDRLQDLMSTMGQVMSDFGKGHRDRKQVEEEILAEIWSNMAAFIYFLTSHEVPVPGYNHPKMVEIYRTLQYANRIV